MTFTRHTKLFHASHALLILLLLLSILSHSCASAAVTPTISLSVDVTSNHASPILSRPIPPNFQGLSIEWWHPRSWVGPSPSSLHQSFLSIGRYLSSSRTVGPILRFGGSTTDESPISTLPSPSWYNQATPKTPLDYATIIAAASALNSSLIIGINNRLGSNLTFVLPELAAIYNVTRSFKSITLEIGNEPEAYECHTQHYRECGWTFDDYLEEWDQLSQTTMTLYPDARPHLFQAGAFSGGWTPQLASMTIQRAPLIHSASFHRYAYPTCDPPLTIDRVLSDDVSLAGLLRPISSGQTLQSMAASIQNGTDDTVLVSLGEGGMNWCLDGDEGVMDRFASALWIVDYSLAIASLNISSFVYYTGWEEPPVFRASPFLIPNATQDAVTVLPLMYGMWTFALAAWNNARFIGSTRVDSTPSPLIKSWVLRDGDDNVVLVLVHKAYNDTGPTSVAVSVTADHPLSEAFVVRLKAGSVMEQHDIQLAGLTFDGTTNGQAKAADGKQPASERINGTAKGGQTVWTVDVMPASVMMVVIPTKADADDAERSWQNRQSDVLRFARSEMAID